MKAITIILITFSLLFSILSELSKVTNLENGEAEIQIPHFSERYSCDYCYSVTFE